MRCSLTTRASSFRPRRALLVPGAATLILACMAGAAAAADVLVVDDDGGPQANFVDLPAAVASASEGDVLLVRPGAYSGFEIANTSLEIVAAIDGTVACTGGIVVRDIAIHQHVTLRGLAVQGVDGPALEVRDSAGAVWIEASTFTGAAGDGAPAAGPHHADGYAGALLDSDARVVFARCTVRGGAGDDAVAGSIAHGDGGDGLHVRASEVAVEQCALRAGSGGSALDDGAGGDGGAGGIGLRVASGAVTASGCTFDGGAGGLGGAFVDPLLGPLCGSGGAGGAAVGQGLADPGPAQVRVLDSARTPGLGGPPAPGSTCSNGANGAPVDLHAGALLELPGDAFWNSVLSPLPDGATALFALRGTPGAFGVLGISAAPSLVFEPGLNGAVQLDFSSLLLFYTGFLPASGAQLSSLPVHLGLAAGQGVSIYTQPLFVVPSTFAVTVGAGSVLTVIDPSL